MAVQLAALGFPGLSWLSSRQHREYDAHPFASLVALSPLVGFIAWGFHRRAS